MDGFQGKKVADPACLRFLQRAGGPDCGPGAGGPTCGDRLATFIMYLRYAGSLQLPGILPWPHALCGVSPGWLFEHQCQTALPTWPSASILSPTHHHLDVHSHACLHACMHMTPHENVPPTHTCFPRRTPTRGGATVFPVADLTKRRMAAAGKATRSDHTWYCQEEEVLGVRPGPGDAILFW